MKGSTIFRGLWAAVLVLHMGIRPVFAAEPLKKIRIASKAPGESLIPYVIAQRLGFYRDEGLDVTIDNFSGGAQALQARRRLLCAARARGIAVALLEEAARHFAALGLTRLRVRTLAANQAALRFYRALGYAPYELTLERELPHARPRRAARKFARRGTRARGRG